jgi:cysteinyl-tRNA synthetase
MGTLAKTTQEEMRAALEDDMNTAQALAAIFDMVREANAAADAGKLLQDDISALQEALTQFDEVFAVLEDDDAAKMKQMLEWARAEGKLAEAAVPEEPSLSDAAIESLIEQRQQARKARDFAKSDAIRKQLADAGVVLEDTKDGLRWKRK